MYGYIMFCVNKFEKKKIFFFFFFFFWGGGGGGGGGEFYFIWHNIKTTSKKSPTNCPTPQKSPMSSK